MNLSDHQNYEDRVRGLLAELEQTHKHHNFELARMRVQLTESTTNAIELETKLKRVEDDLLESLKSERAARQQLARAKLNHRSSQTGFSRGAVKPK